MRFNRKYFSSQFFVIHGKSGSVFVTEHIAFAEVSAETYVQAIPVGFKIIRMYKCRSALFLSWQHTYLRSYVF